MSYSFGKKYDSKLSFEGEYSMIDSNVKEVYRHIDFIKR
jgi:hypothetical protein